MAHFGPVAFPDDDRRGYTVEERELFCARHLERLLRLDAHSPELHETWPENAYTKGLPLQTCGEVPERSNGLAWKASVPFSGYRGFESLPLRHASLGRS